jgi:outer membrane protein assembly factor BamB
VANGVVYIGSRNGILYAFNATTGAQLWTAATGGSITSSPVIANGVVYVGCSTLSGTCTHNLFAFNATSGSQLWTGATGATIESSPIVVDDQPQYAVGAVYVGSGNQVFGFTLPS